MQMYHHRVAVRAGNSRTARIRYFATRKGSSFAAPATAPVRRIRSIPHFAAQGTCHDVAMDRPPELPYPPRARVGLAGRKASRIALLGFAVGWLANTSAEPMPPVSSYANV